MAIQFVWNFCENEDFDDVIITSWSCYYGCPSNIRIFTCNMWPIQSEFGGCGEFGFLCSGSRSSQAESADYAPYDLSENYRVAETDYENYTIVTTCWNLSEESHREIIYLMVRDRNWPSQNQAKIQELLYKVTQWGLHIDSLTLTKQNDCEKWADQEMP